MYEVLFKYMVDFSFFCLSPTESQIMQSDFMDKTERCCEHQCWLRSSPLHGMPGRQNVEFCRKSMRQAERLTHICSQTHTLAALEGIHKNYAADNIFIQIYHSICQLRNMFMELGTHVFTVCSF